MNSILILHNIRSSENVGSIFRTADAVGIDTIFLSGITPAPLDRFGRENVRLTKASLGSEKTVQWEQKKDVLETISALKEMGYQIIAIEQSNRSTDYKKVKVKDKVVFIVGNEVTGLTDEVLAIVDVIAEIPMQGKKESLNVAVATGVALFRMIDR